MRWVKLIAANAFAAAALTVVPGIASSQPLKQGIVGSWSIVSVVDEYEGGKKVNNWGTPKGNVSLDGSGRFSQIIIGDANPALKTADPRKPDAPVVAYYGTYTVDEVAKSVTFKIEHHSFSGRDGMTFTSQVDLKGDRIVMIGSPRKDQQGTFRPLLELRRASAL